LTVYDPGGRKFDETFQLLKGKTWRELDVPKLMSGDTPIPDLTPEAFHYYMPALLIGALKEWPELSNALTFYFCPSSHEELARQYEGDECHYRDWFQKRATLFSSAQRAIIADVLREFVRVGWLDRASIRDAILFLEPSPPENTIREDGQD
jgi:hypothetical protein